MKKICLLSLSALLFLSACTSAADSEKNSEGGDAPGNAEPIALEPADGESELETMAITRAPKTAAEGAYISVKPSFSPFEPALMLFSDQTFTFVENCYEGLASYRGYYTVKDGYVICTPMDEDYSDYAHKDELRFKQVNEYLLQSEQDVSATATGDMFVYVNQATGAGTFTNVQSKSFVEGYEPEITFMNDGTFEMTENLLAGMGTYKGIWLYDGNQYRCKVQEVSFSGFAGDNVSEIAFHYGTDGILYLNTDLCGSRAGHVFKRTAMMDGSKPAETTESTAKKGTVFIVAGADSNRIKVRNGAGLSAADTGERKYSGDKVTVYEEVSKDGYTWYRIGTDRWMAGNGTSFGVRYD